MIYRLGEAKNANGNSNLTKSGGVEGFVKRAWMERDCAAILILMDADKHCALHIATDLSQRIIAMQSKVPVAIVIANCEYEAWFLASLETIAGQDLEGRPGLPTGLTHPGEVESLVGVKGWLTRQLPEGRIYKPTQDQLAMTRLIDTEKARHRSRSFRRLCHALAETVAAIDSGQRIVTPVIAD